MKTRIAFALAPPHGSGRQPYADRPVGQNVEHCIMLECLHLGGTRERGIAMLATAADIGVTLARMARDNRRETA